MEGQYFIEGTVKAPEVKTIAEEIEQACLMHNVTNMSEVARRAGISAVTLTNYQKEDPHSWKIIQRVLAVIRGYSDGVNFNEKHTPKR